MSPARYNSSSIISNSSSSTRNSSNNGSTSNLRKDKSRSRSNSNSYNFANPPSLVEHETKISNFKFLLMGAPTNRDIKHYIKKFNDYHISTIVRVCEPTYSEYLLKKENIKTIDLSFPDGTPPNDKIINKWLDIVLQENIKNKIPLAIHCVAGLGRSSVLVAVALIEYARMQALDAIDLIRSYRRGAINEKQVEWLQNYSPKRHCEDCCIIL